MAVSAVSIGVYEKALCSSDSWEALFTQVRQAGFTFIDLSVDESPERMARLEWSASQRRAVRRAAETTGVQLGGLCLSAHRKVGPASADPKIREQALHMLLAGIDLCADLGIPVLQVAGYYAYYEPAHPRAREYYLQLLRVGAARASIQGVLLGIENVDGTDITSIRAALSICDDVGSAYLQLYPDIGNLAEQQLDVVAELAAGQGRMVAMHAKEVLPGQPRRVPMGQGSVPWPEAFGELARQQWTGRLMLEMWNDDAADSVAKAALAREFLEQQIQAAGIDILSAGDCATVICPQRSELV